MELTSPIVELITTKVELIMPQSGTNHAQSGTDPTQSGTLVHLMASLPQLRKTWSSFKLVVCFLSLYVDLC